MGERPAPRLQHGLFVRLLRRRHPLRLPVTQRLQQRWQLVQPGSAGVPAPPPATRRPRQPQARRRHAAARDERPLHPEDGGVARKHAHVLRR